MKTTLWDDLRQSLYNYFDHQLLENGAYINIVSGHETVRGNDLSLFYPVTDPELYDVSGYIWQSAFHNFVYESGVLNQPSPIVMSGVYINGVFTSKNNGIHIDYANGRVIFDVPLSTNTIVQGNFSYKEYSFVRPDASKAYQNETKYRNNSKVDDFPLAASPNVIHFPAILLEIDDATEIGFQFGGTNQTLPAFSFTILSNSPSQVEAIGSLFCAHSEKSFPIVSANNGPKFNYFNDLEENYSFYTWADKRQNYAFIKSVNYNKIYHRQTDASQPSLFGGKVNIEIFAIR